MAFQAAVEEWNANKEIWSSVRLEAYVEYIEDDPIHKIQMKGKRVQF